MIRDAAAAAPPRPAAPERTPALPTPGERATSGLVAPGIPMLNPRMRIDTELNLVVLEFRDDAGEVRQSLPSPREIDAYRLAAREPAEPEPPLTGLDVTR